VAHTRLSSHVDKAELTGLHQFVAKESILRNATVRKTAGWQWKKAVLQTPARGQKRTLEKIDVEIAVAVIIEHGHPRPHIFVKQELAGGSCEVLKIEAHISGHFTEDLFPRDPCPEGRAFGARRLRAVILIRNASTSCGSGKKTDENFSRGGEKERGGAGSHWVPFASFNCCRNRCK